MEPEKNLEPCSEKVIYKCEIPFKMPSLNDYIRENRSNKYKGAQMKKSLERDIGLYIHRLPVFNKPIHIHFIWVEGNKRRDLDNIPLAKIFIIRQTFKQRRIWISAPTSL